MEKAPSDVPFEQLACSLDFAQRDQKRKQCHRRMIHQGSNVAHLLLALGAPCAQPLQDARLSCSELGAHGAVARPRKCTSST